MNITIDTLQRHINTRAGARLDKDLAAISSFIRGNRILADTTKTPYLTFDMVKAEGQEIANKDSRGPYWVFQFEVNNTVYRSVASSPYMDNLRAAWLPVYIKEETEAFLAQVQDLQMGPGGDDVTDAVFEEQ